MTMPRAIRLTKKHLEVIANTGVITIADVTAIWELSRENHESLYFILDCPVDPNGTIVDWATAVHDYFNSHFVWTEPDKTGFRYCRRIWGSKS